MKMQPLSWNNPRATTPDVFYGERGWMLRIKPRLRRRDKNVLDMPLYRSGVCTHYRVTECNRNITTAICCHRYCKRRPVKTFAGGALQCGGWGGCSREAAHLALTGIVCWRCTLPRSFLGH